MILVDNRLANDEDLLGLDVVEVMDRGRGAVTGRKAAQVGPNFLRKDRQVPVHQVGCTEDYVVGELQPAADRRDRGLFQWDGARAVGVRAELRAFDKDIRPERLNGLNRHRPVVDGDEIDALQRRDCFGPKLLREHRPVRALVDIVVRSHGDDEDLPQPLGLLEMANVPNVERIKDAVAMHDLLVVPAQAGQQSGQLGDVLDLAPESVRAVPPDKFRFSFHHTAPPWIAGPSFRTRCAALRQSAAHREVRPWWRRSLHSV